MSLAYVGEKDEITPYFASMGIANNQYVIQVNMSVTGISSNFDFGYDEIKVPIIVSLVGDEMLANEQEYGVSFYIYDKSAKQIIDKLNAEKLVDFAAVIGDSDESEQLSISKTRLKLGYQLLKTCEGFLSNT